ncbi:MAG: hypothetical protein VX527_05155 [Planctomycetota bacterium]|nr:hypothetical protein [Planctomycetota bacterium]
MIDQQQHDIARIVGLVSRRERVSAGLAWFSGACLCLAVLAVALAVVDRLGSQPWVPWRWVILAFAVMAVTTGLIGWWQRRPRPILMAQRVDDRLGLKDRLSSAMACHHRQDPFAKALVEDAGSVARSPQTREQVRRRFRVTPPPLWWTSPVLILVAFIVAIFGQWDLLSAREIDTVDLNQVRETAAESVEASVEAIREDPELSEAMSDVLEELEAETDASLQEKEDEESIRREALKRLTELNRNLEDILDGPEGETLESLEESLESLDTSKESPIQDLVEALKKSDFTQAKETLSKLQEKIDSGEMSDSERAEVADALESLSEQLQEQADNQESMREALKQAGLDPELANDPQALKQALEQATDLNESQKQQLEDKSEANEQSKKMLEQLSEASQEACEQCRGGEEGEEGKPGSCQGMSEKLGAMEQLQQMLQKAQDAQSACQSQCDKLGEGLAKQQACNAAGEKGLGESVGSEQTETNVVAEEQRSEAGDGPIASRVPVDRELVVGESTMTLQQAQQAASEGFDEALDESPLPRQYHDALKHYFSDREAVESAMEADTEAKEDKSEPENSEEESETESESNETVTKGAGGEES